MHHSVGAPAQASLHSDVFSGSSLPNKLCSPHNFLDQEECPHPTSPLPFPAAHSCRPSALAQLPWHLPAARAFRAMALLNGPSSSLHLSCWVRPARCMPPG